MTFCLVCVCRTGQLSCNDTQLSNGAIHVSRVPGHYLTPYDAGADTRRIRSSRLSREAELNIERELNAPVPVRLFLKGSPTPQLETPTSFTQLLVPNFLKKSWVHAHCEPMAVGAALVAW